LLETFIRVKKFLGTGLVNKKKRCLNYDFHCFRRKMEDLQYMIKLESHMDNSMFQKTV
jgi:hypothetical protein